MSRPPDPETLYTSPHTPDPKSARDVLAFVLTPAAAFVNTLAELEQVGDLLASAKEEAIVRWKSLNGIE